MWAWNFDAKDELNIHQKGFESLNQIKYLRDVREAVLMWSTAEYPLTTHKLFDN